MIDAMTVPRRFSLAFLALAIAGFCVMVFEIPGGRLVQGFKDVAFDEVLDLDLVGNLKVEELPGATPTRLRISGFVFKSWKSVTKITTEKTSSAIVVFVHVFLTRPGTTGQIDYELPIPDSVTEVRFGNNAKVIWTRGSSLPSR